MVRKVASTGALAIAVALAISACSPAASQSAAANQVNPQSQLIAQLQEAKQRDLHLALQPGTTPVGQGDLMVAATKADTVIDKLNHGEEVSQADITEALIVPPPSLTPEQRADYIVKLRAACELDNRGWTHNTRYSVSPQEYLVQYTMCDQAVRELRTGQEVSYYTLQQALHVPRNP
jgi:autonomous glycyl radical cofactor GrcA